MILWQSKQNGFNVEISFIFFFFMPFSYILDLLQLYIRLIDVCNVGGGTAEYYL